MDTQNIHGVSSIGSKLRQEIRRSTQSYHEKRHYFWKRHAYILWLVIVILLFWILFG